MSDPTGTLASPYEVVERSGDRSQDHRRLAAIVVEAEAERVVVGMPLSLDGSEGRAAKAAAEEVAVLAEVLSVPVETWDERLTTVTAHQGMAAAGKRSRQRRGSVDKVAATVLLQAWLDARRSAERDGR